MVDIHLTAGLQCDQLTLVTLSKFCLAQCTGIKFYIPALLIILAS